MPLPGVGSAGTSGSGNLDPGHAEGPSRRTAVGHHFSTREETAMAKHDAEDAKKRKKHKKDSKHHKRPKKHSGGIDKKHKKMQQGRGVRGRGSCTVLSAAP